MKLKPLKSKNFIIVLKVLRKIYIGLAIAVWSIFVYKLLTEGIEL